MRDYSGVGRITEPHNNEVGSQFVGSFEDLLATGLRDSNSACNSGLVSSPALPGEFCQPLQGSHACLPLPVRQSFVGARWWGWNDTQDVLVFTAGVGENSPEVRAATCNGLDFLGVAIDLDRNKESLPDAKISSPDSRVKVLVIGTAEDWAIAGECWQLCRCPAAVA